LLYLEDNSTRYSDAGNQGWLDAHAKTKLRFWTNEFPAEIEDTMREAHRACIPPRYAESDIEIARFEYGVAGTLRDQPLQSRRSLLQSMYTELREKAALTAAIDVNLHKQPTMNIIV